MLSLQYLSDYTGKHTAVVIPIALWEKIVCKYPDLRLLEQHPSREKACLRKHTMGDSAGSLASDSADGFQTD